MDWLLTNWFWILVFVLFIAMHLFGHGGHGGGSHQQRRPHAEGEGANVPPDDRSPGAGGRSHH